MNEDSGEASRRSEFSTTHWTVVLEAMNENPALAQEALQRLCSRYWYPVYAFIRHKGHSQHEAEDLTQGFFYYLLKREGFRAADPQKGRFRTFLLSAASNFLKNEWDRKAAQKRGGTHEFVPLDEQGAEEIYLQEPREVSPEAYFDRSWAVMIARRVFDGLRQDYQRRGQGAIFAALKTYLTGEAEAGAFERLGGQLGMEPGTIKVGLHRLRRRFGELLRREVAHTVEEPGEVEGEIRHLLAALGQ